MQHGLSFVSQREIDPRIGRGPRGGVATIRMFKTRNAPVGIGLRVDERGAGDARDAPQIAKAIRGARQDELIVKGIVLDRGDPVRVTAPQHQCRLRGGPQIPKFHESIGPRRGQDVGFVGIVIQIEHGGATVRRKLIHRTNGNGLIRAPIKDAHPIVRARDGRRVGRVGIPSDAGRRRQVKVLGRRGTVSNLRGLFKFNVPSLDIAELIRREHIAFGRRSGW
mmetsp:Transcript_11307/g.31201  ORF Transcript_11307/g.31201 Transcript_11307/m.31201 type:complete len:222 (-) Transcript_11307:538-1203(-)